MMAKYSMTGNVSAIMRFGEDMVEVTPSGTLIRFADGTTVSGRPEDTDAYRQRAQETGYAADTLSFCIEHEIMHMALAHWLGLPDSPTMLAVRTDRPEQALALRRLEEAAVQAIQHFARAAAVDVVARFRKPDRTT